MANRRYEIELTRQAERDLKALRPWVKQAMDALLALEDQPEKGHTLSGSLQGARSLEFSLKGIGQCREVYFVDEDDAVVLVCIIGSHENIYKKALSRVEALRRAGRI